MGLITASDINDLNTRIKALFNERQNFIEGGINVSTGTGRKTAPVDFSTTPAVGGKILADAYNKTFGALNAATMTFDSTLTASTMTAGTKIPTQAQYTNARNWAINKRISNLCSSGSVTTITKANSGCDTYCTGLCSGTCYTTSGASNDCMCTTTCSNSCYRQCAESCVGNCTSCTGSNKSSTPANCSCTSCTGSCSDICQGCQGQCSGGCQGGCTNSSTALT